MDLRAVKAAPSSELADCAIAAARNAIGLLDDAELLAGAGRDGRAYAMAVLAVEECGKAAEMATLAVMHPSLRARAPLRRMLEGHQMKLVGGMMVGAFPFGRMAGIIVAMTADELAERMTVLAPADKSNSLGRAGLYVDLEPDGIHKPTAITGADVKEQLDRARQAAATAAAMLAPEFQVWLADPPADGVELIGEAVAALTQADDARTPQDAAEVIRQAVQRFRERRAN